MQKLSRCGWLGISSIYTPFIFYCLVSWLIATSQADSLAPYEPAEGCYIGAYIELDPVARNDVATFEQLTGKKHASYFRYVGWGQPFPFQWANHLKAIGAMPHIAWEPNEGLGPVKDDDYLRGWAEACANYGGPIFIRFASEMNGDWQAYSGDPDLYIKKWRMVYEIINSIAPNVIMCWCPFASPKSTIPLYYPGDDYVDWVGVNAYSVLVHEGNVSKRAVDDTIQHIEFIYNLYAERKPIAICEYAATHYCKGSNSEAVVFAVREMRKLYEALINRFPRVKMINWFSVDTVSENLAHNDYSLTSDQTVLAAYRELINSPHFLSSVVGPTMTLAGPPSEVVPGGPLSVPGIEIPTDALPMMEPPTPRTSLPLALAELAAPPANGLAIVIKGGAPAALTGRVTVEAIPGKALQPDRVSIEIDGRVRALTNAAPFSFPWNATKATVGEHRIRALARDIDGGIIAEAQASVVVIAPEPAL